MIMEKELNSIPVPLVYKPKPIPVEVVQFNRTDDEFIKFISDWCGGKKYTRSCDDGTEEVYFEVNVNNGKAREWVEPGQWIIKHRNQIRVLMPEIFAHYFEKDYYLVEDI